MKSRITYILCALMLATLATGVRAQDQVAVSASENAGLWLIELSQAPLADGGNAAALKSEKQAFRAAARSAGLSYQERYAFDNLWNGLSIAIQAKDLANFTRLPGVKAVYPNIVMSLPEPVNEATPEMMTALAMTGADVAQNELGLSGAGVRVGIIDTGVDYRHPDLGGCFGPGCRVVTGYDFVGDAYNAGGTGGALIPVPDDDPEDCAGHGTHVSGIVGASGTITGVAPGVKFGAYRVFGCSGSTSGDIMIAAMERALADGMQVVNMSIGSAYQWPQYPTAMASDRLVNKGVVVVASIGNEGANGLYSAGAPGVGKKVIGVAAFDNTYTNLAAFTISPDNMGIGYITASGGPPAPLTGTTNMARRGTPTTTNDGCAALPAGSMAGKIVLIRRGTCSFYIKAWNAQQAGAAGVVLYNNTTGLVSPTVAGTPAITIPVVAISQADGAATDARIAGGTVDMTWTNQVVSLPNTTGNRISSFSSYGLAADLSLKPDLGAPGGLIRSTYPVALGSYANLSGTSMSSPHVAGGVALLLEAHPNTPSQAVRRILQNSAVPRNWWGNPGLGFLDNVHRQGAGMMDIPGAVLATTQIEPGALALGESEFGPVTRTLSIANNSEGDVTYNLSHAAALATGPNTFTPSFLNAPATVTFSAASVTVPAGGSASVDITISPNAGLADRSLYGGYAVFTPQGGGAVYRVPFAGFKGDYQGFPVLTPTTNGFPWLARAVGASFVKQTSGGTFTLAGADVPYILVHLDHQVRRMRMEVNDAMSGKSWHRAMQFDYVGRNSTATGFFALPWDGMTVGGQKIYAVPNGQYIITLTIEKALSDGTSTSDYETWTSPVITVARP